MMQQTVTVVSLLPNGRAVVEHERPSACSGDCHKCAGCGAVTQTLRLEADNPIAAQPGSRVIVDSRSTAVLKAAFVVYCLPLLLFFGGYGLGSAVGWFPALCGGLGFVIGVAWIMLYNRRLTRRQAVRYTIVEYAPGEQWPDQREE